MTLQDRHRSLGVLIALVVAAWLPSLAFAGPSRKGNSFNASGLVGVGSKITDIAYDPANDVYLFVSGSREYLGGHVFGRFLQGDGTLLGATLFKIPETNAFTQLPRVTYSAALGGFLVTWIDTRVNPALGQVWGRFVKHGGGGAPSFTTGDFMIDSVTGGTQPEVPAAVACAGAKEECLVAWHNRGGGSEAGNDIHAVRINLAGQVIGAELFLTNDNHWQTLPAVGYDPANGVYLVAVQAYSHTGGIWAYRVQADSGALLGNAVLAEGGELYKPEVAFNSQSGQFLVSWLHSNSKVWNGRFIKSDGAVGNIIPLLAGYGGYDANGLAYNPTSGSFLAVTHGNSVEDIGYEISGAGVPSAEFTATNTGGGGNFYPRVAAHNGRGEWLMTASSSFTFVSGTIVTTDTTGGPGGGGGGGGGGGDTEIIDLSQSGAPNGSWFLAEGVAQNTANGFVTFYLIVNENQEAVNVRGYFSREDGKTFSRTFTVGPNSRATLNLAAEFGVGTFGAVFQSLTPGLDIFVERSIYWGPNLEGSTSEVATRSLAFEWYFGEGSRDFFSNYFLLFNPNQVGGSATFTFFLENGTQVQRVVPFGPQQRVTMDAGSVPELTAQNFGVKVTSTVPVVAERAMYFGLGPAGFIGGTASVGAPGLVGDWFFAEGAAAPGFHTFFLLMNPSSSPIEVERTFYLEDGSLLRGLVTVPAGSRKTIYLNDEMGHIGGAAAKFSSSSPFIAERSIYWGANGWVEGTNVIGSPGLAAEWHVPEGTETGDFDAFLLILNPHLGVSVTVDVIVYIEGLGRFTAPVNMRPVIGGGSRLTINMRDFLTQMEQAGGYAPGTLANTSFSTRVRTTGGENIVVEHALYRTFDGNNRWRSGSASFGVPR